jgi:hypothetical protein
VQNGKTKGVKVNFTFNPTKSHAKTKAASSPNSKKTRAHR